MEKNLTEWLREHGILVRSRADYMRIDENEMEETLLVHYKKSSKLRKYLGIDGLITTNQYDELTSGTADIVACVIDSLDIVGGQCSSLYPEKPIYDIPAYAEISAQQLIENIMNQIKPFDPKLILGERVEQIDMFLFSFLLQLI